LRHKHTTVTDTRKDIYTVYLLIRQRHVLLAVDRYALQQRVQAVQVTQPVQQARHAGVGLQKDAEQFAGR
jgi:hypothetical protein